MILGFLIVPRTLISAESGLMLTLGFWLLKEALVQQNPKVFSPIRYSFQGLLLTGLTGIILGLTLARPTIDPIPFRGIEIHSLMGLAFTLSTLQLILPHGRQQPDRPEGLIPALLYTSGILVLFSIPVIGRGWHAPLIALVLLFIGLFIGLKGVHPERSGKSALWMIGGAIVVLSALSWNSISGVSLPFFLMAWLYALSSPIFPGKLEQLSGNLGFLIILVGLWKRNIQMVGAGVGLHLIAFTAILFHIYQNRGDQILKRPPSKDISGSSGTDSSQTSRS